MGYYVRTDYDTEELNLEPPPAPIVERLVRTIAADQPRVTRFQIDWSPPQQVVEQSVPKEDGMMDVAGQEPPVATPPAPFGQHPETVCADANVAMGMVADHMTGLPAGPTQSTLYPSIQPVPFPIDTR